MSSEEQKPISTDTPEAAGCSWSPNHVTGNLFSCPADESLAHCISEDLGMGAGIAVMFKKTFRGVPELKAQGKQPGQCAVLQRGDRFVYYLITKKRYFHKPTYQSLQQSLEDMREHCISHQVTRVSMPRIGCGLDRLQWVKVEQILKEVFKDTDISITVYSLPPKNTLAKETKQR